jgi:hypothetical protein
MSHATAPPHRSKKLVPALLGLGLALLALASQPASAVRPQDIAKGTYGSIYALTWDGFQGTLTLRVDGSGYLTVGRTNYAVRAVYSANPQDTIVGYQGPGYRVATSNAHRVVFWVDFANTPNPYDDQRFDGYFFTQTLNGMAGVTWWANIPFGFYARYLGDVIG